MFRVHFLSSCLSLASCLVRLAPVSPVLNTRYHRNFRVTTSLLFLNILLSKFLSHISNSHPQSSRNSARLESILALTKSAQKLTKLWIFFTTLFPIIVALVVYIRGKENKNPCHDRCDHFD